MYDYWLNAIENNEYAGACLLDMSAAFDIVDHYLQMRYLKSYTIMEKTPYKQMGAGLLIG